MVNLQLLVNAIDENSDENNERIKIYDYKIEGVEYHLYLIILK